MLLKYELQSIISGIGRNPARNLIETAACYLGEGQKTGGGTAANKFTKEQEAAKLIDWIEASGLWYGEPNQDRYLARGAEQRVYLERDGRHVIKLNDSIFYASWLDYFHNLLIHNHLFPETAYDLIGFYTENKALHAVVRQQFIEITEPTDPLQVKNFLSANGFQLIKNNDFTNNSVGLILEDLHDENVLTKQRTLFFIDTAFYLMPSFFQ